MVGTLRTAGLSLKVDGAAGFQQALNNASQAINRNNAEMKLLEATYGKSSTAMEYLSQRSQLLAQKLEEQQKKTAVLQEARDKYAASSEVDQAKLEKLDLQIIKSQTAEADLARQIKACSAEMDKQAQGADDAARSQEKLEEAGQDAASAQKQLGSAVAAVAADMDAAGRSADAYVKKIEGIGKGMERAGKMGTRFLTLPIMGMGTAAVKYGMDLEDAIYEVATLPGVLSGSIEEQAAQLEEYADQLIAASDRSYTNAAELAAAQYDAISANVAPENSVYWAERAAKAGVAGRTDAATVVSGASSVYNAWGKDATKGLDHILDVMMTAQNKGKTTVGELAGSVGQITGLAPQVGMAMEEIFAGVAAMTRNGVQTSSAITGLRGVLSAVIKPTEQAKKMAEELGLQFDVSAVQTKGFTGFLADVADKTNGDSEALGKLFGNVEGLNAVMQLAGTASKDYIEILQEMQSATGVLDKAFETRISSRAMQLRGSVNQLKNSGIELIENLYPAVDVVTDLLGKASNLVGGMDEEAQKHLLGVLGFTAAVGPATTAAGKLLKSFGAIRAAMTSPWGWAALGAVGVGALVYQLATAETAVQRMEKAAKEINLGVSDQSVAGMEEQIKRVMALVEKQYYVDAQVNWTLDDDIQQQLTTTFQNAFNDARIDMSEYTDLMAILHGDIGGEVSEAMKDPLTAALAEELQGAVNQFNGLLELIYRQGGTATEQEIADLEIALERVKALRAQLLGAWTEADQAEMSTYEQAYQHNSKGFGNETTMVNAMAWSAGNYSAAIKALEADAKESDLRLQESLNAAKTTEEMQRAQDIYEIEEAQQAELENAIRGEYTQDMNVNIAGWLSGSEEGRQIAEQMARLGMLLDIQSAMIADAKTYEETGDSRQPALQQTLTPDVIEALGFSDLGLLKPDGELWLSNERGFSAMRRAVEEQSGNLVEELKTTLAAEDNPLAQALGAWFSTGFDADDIDVTQASGELAALLRLMLFQEEGLDALGTEAMEAIGSGIVEAGPDVVEDADDIADAIGAALRNVDNPYRAGYDAIDEMRRGMQEAEPELMMAARSIMGSVSDALYFITPGEGIFSGNGVSGGALSGSYGNSVDSSVTVNIHRANMSSPASASALANQIGAISNQRLAAVGITG